MAGQSGILYNRKLSRQETLGNYCLQAVNLQDELASVGWCCGQELSNLFQQYMTCLYRHVIYCWKTRNLTVAVVPCRIIYCGACHAKFAQVSRTLILAVLQYALIYIWCPLSEPSILTSAIDFQISISPEVALSPGFKIFPFSLPDIDVHLHIPDISLQTMHFFINRLLFGLKIG